MTVLGLTPATYTIAAAVAPVNGSSSSGSGSGSGSGSQGVGLIPLSAGVPATGTGRQTQHHLAMAHTPRHGTHHPASRLSPHGPCFPSFPHDRVRVRVRGATLSSYPGAVEEGQFAYFTLQPGPATEDLHVTATALSGDVDLYLGASWDDRPRFEVRRVSLPLRPSHWPIVSPTVVLPIPRYDVLSPVIIDGV